VNNNNNLRNCINFRKKKEKKIRPYLFILQWLKKRK